MEKLKQRPRPCHRVGRARALSSRHFPVAGSPVSHLPLGVLPRPPRRGGDPSTAAQDRGEACACAGGQHTGPGHRAGAAPAGGGVRGRQPGPTGGCLSLEATTLPRGYRPTAQAPQHRASDEGMNLYVKGREWGGGAE